MFLGTLYPLFLDAVGGPKVSVGPPFFDRTFAPIMVPVLIAMAVGPMLSWKRGDLLGALQRLWIAFAAACLHEIEHIYLFWLYAGHREFYDAGGFAGIMASGGKRD